MIPWHQVGSTPLGGHAVLSLWRRDLDGRPPEFSLRINEPNLPVTELMNSRQNASEQLLAERAIDALGRPAANVLIGGLGMGYTLRAALDRLGAEARVTVAELLADVVGWNREHMGDLAGRPLDDPRVGVHVGDVGELLTGAGRYDLILLDTDNGPEGTSREENEELYSTAGLSRAHAALLPGGLLAVWSAFPSGEFTRRLERCGFDTKVTQARAFGKRGARHVIWLARRR
ncbi:MAG: hypothetical protein WDA03_08885 [Trueperaceae bacterium]